MKFKNDECEMTICPCPQLMAWFQPSSPESEPSPGVGKVQTPLPILKKRPPIDPTSNSDEDVGLTKASNVKNRVTFNLPTPNGAEKGLTESEQIERSIKMRLDCDVRRQREYTKEFLAQSNRYTKEDILLIVAARVSGALEWLMPSDPKDD